MKISDTTPVSMPMKNLISIIAACLVGAWFAFTVIERLNVIEKTDVEKELPEITALKLKVAFLEDRIEKAETLIDKLRNNGTH